MRASLAWRILSPRRKINRNKKDDKKDNSGSETQKYEFVSDCYPRSTGKKGWNNDIKKKNGRRREKNSRTKIRTKNLDTEKGTRKNMHMVEKLARTQE